MILVVDSGSYKSDWMTKAPDGETIITKSKGLNPMFASEKEIYKVIDNITELVPYRELIREVYFFGSGCVTPDRRENVSNALSLVFKHAFVSVDTDQMGSAYATCGDQRGFIVNLGTGSSISFYDGETVQENKSGLGFILGDQGAGTWFGQHLVTSYLYGTMPEELQEAFANRYSIDKNIIIKNVYQKGHPNTYLSSFAPFMHQHREHPFIQSLLYNGFTEFFKTHLLLYTNYQAHLCHFVGAISYHFQQELVHVSKQFSANVGKIIERPIEELYRFMIEREIA